MQPSYLVKDFIASGRLRVILPEWSLPELDIHALYPSRRYMPVALRALLDFLVQRFEQQPW
ncbi:LysR substrate-binding domain-containing protein [Alkalimonas mucilaginosa]|uniref:LysR substrate-binding domain-containing protein n=1 Tax=Alkalimonas mucilaginosa TaxID=3057676 RepID=A0ABU7JI86_9GAMM|nr:LysR substrate-binding domain-containing protein [Alkalimonas sp. MEB004]MEE2024820.1 LysR substrate-binding domain-containing protein [Alkalimonas sp. MEB004]